MVKHISIVVGFLVGFSLAPVPIGATTYHVSTTGHDENDGIFAPFRTIAHGCSVLASGDSLLIESGDYGTELDIHLTVSGSTGDPIVIRADPPRTVYLNGTRGPDDLDGGGSCLSIEASYVEVDGLSFRDFSVAIAVDGSSGDVHHQTFRRCTFTTNGEVGIENWRNDHVLVSECRFIDDYTPDPAGEYAIQDYGVNFYWNSDLRVEDCYFFGNHHQACSFKKGNDAGVVTRCVFEGAMYTAIFFGQEGTPEARCHNLVAEDNIVRPAVGHHVKSPVHVANVSDAIVRNNYFEGFDGAPAVGGGEAGITIWPLVGGRIEVYGNYLAYDVERPGITIEANSADSVMVYHNSIHDLDADLYIYGDDNLLLVNNLASGCSSENMGEYANNYVGDPHFVGPLGPLPLSAEPSYLTYDPYFMDLISPLALAAESPCIDMGVDLGLRPFLGTAPDMGAFEFDPSSTIEEPPWTEPSVRLQASSPNPMGSSSSIVFSLHHPSVVTITIFDSAGRLLRTLVHGRMLGGTHNVSWDGRDKQGRSVTSGVYTLCLETETESISRNQVVIR